MSNFIVRDLLSIVGKLQLDNDERYSEWLLSSILRVKGYKMRSAFIRDDNVVYESIGREYHYLCADVYITLNPEQKRFFNTDNDTLIITIPARYLGSEDNWLNLFYVYADDLCIRYGEDIHGDPYRITFSRVLIDGKEHVLSGERLDWTWFELQEQRAELFEESGANDYEPEPYEDESYGVINSYYYEYESDLADAFGGDLSQWRCR